MLWLVAFLLSGKLSESNDLLHFRHELLHLTSQSSKFLLL